MTIWKKEIGADYEKQLYKNVTVYYHAGVFSLKSFSDA